MCYWSRLYFLRFCCSFLKHLVKISDAFQLDILREKLISTKHCFWKLICNSKNKQTKSLKTPIFLIQHFWNLFKILIHYYFFKLFPLQLQWENFWMCYLSRLHFLRFCCPFLKHLVKISDVFQIDILREKLIIFKT